MKLLAYLFLAVIFYLIASFINTELNPLLWGIFTKIIYSIGAVWSLMMFSSEDIID